MKKILPLLLFIVLLSQGCSNDSEGDLVEEKKDNNQSDLVTYNANIKSIMGGNCTACHSNPPVNGAPFALSTYTQVKSRASDLLGAISKETGESGAMPPAGKLPQNTIDLIKKWIDDGLLEN